MAENVDLTFLAKLAQDNLAEMKAVRREVTDIRTLALQTADYIRKMEQRLDGRMVGVRDDLELLLKSELMGSLAHFETRIENFLQERLAGLEKTD